MSSLQLDASREQLLSPAFPSPGHLQLSGLPSLFLSWFWDQLPAQLWPQLPQQTPAPTTPARSLCQGVQLMWGETGWEKGQQRQDPHSCSRKDDPGAVPPEGLHGRRGLAEESTPVRAPTEEQPWLPQASSAQGSGLGESWEPTELCPPGGHSWSRITSSSLSHRTSGATSSRCTTPQQRAIKY